MIALEHMKPSPEALGAFARDYDVPKLVDRHANGGVGFFAVKAIDAALVLSVGQTIDTNRKALWIEALGGKATMNAKKNARLVGDVLKDCEELAIASGADEIRIEASTRTRLKLALFEAFGFKPLKVGPLTVMQKVLTHVS